MIEHPVRYIKGHKIAVPTSDWRTHPDTAVGEQYLYGKGVAHHDLVNVPFYGQLYDTAIIAHPLSPSDCLSDPRMKTNHIQFVMCQLRDLQTQARADHRTTLGELRARQDSIEVLSNLRRKAFEKLSSRYFAQKANEAATLMTATEDSDQESNFADPPTDPTDPIICPGKSLSQADSKSFLSIKPELTEDGAVYRLTTRPGESSLLDSLTISPTSESNSIENTSKTAESNNRGVNEWSDIGGALKL